MTILHKIHRMFSKHWLEMHIILFCAIDASIRLVGNLQFFVDKRGCYYKAAWMNTLFLSIGYKWTAFWRWPFIQMTLLGFLTFFSFFFWWLLMHSVGFEPMRSAFILFLQGDGVPFDLELIGYVWQERNNSIFEDNERSLDLLKLLYFSGLIFGFLNNVFQFLLSYNLLALALELFVFFHVQGVHHHEHDVHFIQ